MSVQVSHISLSLSIADHFLVQPCAIARFRRIRWQFLMYAHTTEHISLHLSPISLNLLSRMILRAFLLFYVHFYYSACISIILRAFLLFNKHFYYFTNFFVQFSIRLYSQKSKLKIGALNKYSLVSVNDWLLMLKSIFLFFFESFSCCFALLFQSDLCVPLMPLCSCISSPLFLLTVANFDASLFLSFWMKSWIYKLSFTITSKQLR